MGLEIGDWDWGLGFWIGIGQQDCMVLNETNIEYRSCKIKAVRVNFNLDQKPKYTQLI